jgi:hypothetical protein
VSTCTIRYRFNGPGPAALVVECGGEPRLYSRGMLSAPMSEGHLAELLTSRTGSWVAAAGTLIIEGDVETISVPSRFSTGESPMIDLDSVDTASA